MSPTLQLKKNVLPAVVLKIYCYFTQVPCILRDNLIFVDYWVNASLKNKEGGRIYGTAPEKS